MENTVTTYQSAKDILASMHGPSITLNASALTFDPFASTTTNCNLWEQLIEDKLKEYCYSTDKHLDDLEEDIEFLDKQRKEMNSNIEYHSDMVSHFQADISLLKDENTRLRGALNDLQNQIFALQQRLDNK